MGDYLSCSCAETAEKGGVMSPIAICIGFLIALFTMLLFHAMGTPRPQITEAGTQRMCPSCGLITSRLKAYCLECGKSLSPVVSSRVEK